VVYLRACGSKDLRGYSRQRFRGLARLLVTLVRALVIASVLVAYRACTAASVTVVAFASYAEGVYCVMCCCY
jgi:hypothetical protein